MYRSCLMLSYSSLFNSPLHGRSLRAGHVHRSASIDFEAKVVLEAEIEAIAAYYDWISFG